MDNLAWYYDLCRLPKGGFDMVGGGMYSGENWGSGGMGLAYTAPLRTLRITGGPPTKFSKRVVLTGFPWGNNRDLAFLGNEYGKGFGKEEFAPHKVYRMLGDQYAKPTAGARPTEIVRPHAVSLSVGRATPRAVAGQNGGGQRDRPALQDPDPRGPPRRATASTCTGPEATPQRRIPAEGRFGEVPPGN